MSQLPPGVGYVARGCKAVEVEQQRHGSNQSETNRDDVQQHGIPHSPFCNAQYTDVLLLAWTAAKGGVQGSAHQGHFGVFSKDFLGTWLAARQ